MLNDLTPEQDKLADELSNEYILDAHCGETLINQRQAANVLQKIYALAELSAPRILFLDGPMEAIQFCKEELKTEVDTIDWFGIGYDSGWVSFFDYFQRIGVLARDDEEFNLIKDFLRSGVWATLLFENLAICIPRPNTVKTDAQGSLHCENGPAILFDDNYGEYAWHGAWVTEQIIMKPETLTKKQILKEKNSEVQRAIAEKLGWEKYLKLVDVKLIDKWFDANTSCHYELYDFKRRLGVLQPRLLKMESPELNDGTRPFYIEPVPPESKTCRSARRWQCDPSRPEITECNKNPELVFEQER